MIRPTPGDSRRAAALIAHHWTPTPDEAGIKVVLAEAHETGRVTELFLATLDTLHTTLPAYLDEDGVNAFAEAIDGLTGDSDDDVRRAATAIRGRQLRVAEWVQAALNEANNNGGAVPLFLTVLELHTTLVPRLRSPEAVAAMKVAAMNSALTEDGTDTPTPESEL